MLEFISFVVLVPAVLYFYIKSLRTQKLLDKVRKESLAYREEVERLQLLSTLEISDMGVVRRGNVKPSCFGLIKPSPDLFSRASRNSNRKRSNHSDGYSGSSGIDDRIHYDTSSAIDSGSSSSHSSSSSSGSSFSGGGGDFGGGGSGSSDW